MKINWNTAVRRGVAVVAVIGAAMIRAPIAEAQTPFTLGSLVVNRLGDGTTALSGTSTFITVQEFATSGGSPIQSIAIPGTGAGAVSDSGSASSNGYLNYYDNSVWVPGYLTANGTATVADTLTAVVPRAIVPIASDGTIGTTATLGTGFSGNNIRSAIGTGALVFASGTATSTNNGVRYNNSSNSSIRISSTVTNVRNLEIYNDELMFSTGSGTTGIYTLGAVSSLNLSGADLNTATLLIGGLASPYGFFVDADNGVAFVADDSTGTSGGLFRFDFDGVAWNQTYRFNVNTGNNTFTTAATGGSVTTIRGLAAEYDPLSSLYNVYVTDSRTTNNGLLSFTDGLTPTLTNGSSFSVVATAGTNYVFRGVDIVPVPEPGSLALLACGGVAFLAWTRKRRTSK